MRNYDTQLIKWLKKLLKWAHQRGSCIGCSIIISNCVYPS
uniref:Uncharacterized protein n=1 Tax=Lepeophtheirus salmonis TaxID=72036 RepID=A0A0K2UJL8_LEPSM